MSRIRIKNFGPIKDGYKQDDGWLNVNNVTVFIGSQGSGKSTVAKLISTFTWLEKALVRGDFGNKKISINNFRRHISYQNIEEYLKEDSIIEYEGIAYNISYKAGVVAVHKNESSGYVFPKIMYVPSERNFISAVRNLDTLKGLPSTLYTFSDEFFKAVEDLRGQVNLPINNSIYEYQKLNKLSWISGDDYKIKLTQASSGFQSFVPLYLVTRYLAGSIGDESDNNISGISIEEAKRIRREIEDIISNPNLSEDVKKLSLEVLSANSTYGSFINIVEEPEQNLFPGSQHEMLNSLLQYKNMGAGNKLILTTHSPYIIMYLSIAMQAGILQAKKLPDALRKKLDDVVPLDSTLNKGELSVYQLDEKTGCIFNLPDFDGIPSDNNFLNGSLSEGNAAFDKLLEIEQEL